MLRTTSLLIVMVLAAGPAGSLACDLWCNSPAADPHHRAIGCHDASPASPIGQQIAPASGCHDAAGIAPFVREVRQTESLGNPIASPAVVELSSIGIDHDGIATGWWVFKVQPPRPPSSRAVLRV
jgi:hypothetical protein